MSNNTKNGLGIGIGIGIGIRTNIYQKQNHCDTLTISDLSTAYNGTNSSYSNNWSPLRSKRNCHVDRNRNRCMRTQNEGYISNRAPSKDEIQTHCFVHVDSPNPTAKYVATHANIAEITT